MGVKHLQPPLLGDNVEAISLFGVTRSSAKKASPLRPFRLFRIRITPAKTF